MRDTTKLRIKTGAAFFVVAIIFFVTVGGLSAIFIKGCSDINERGLKNIIEEVWEGRQQNQGEKE
jgi:ABC-type phosphate transport system permease subunit